MEWLPTKKGIEEQARKFKECGTMKNSEPTEGATIDGRFALGARHWRGLLGIVLIFLALWAVYAAWPQSLIEIVGRKKVLINAVLNGVTLGGLYFLVASGFTLVFGLMRNINLAHGSLYLLGAYIGYEVATATEWWYAGVIAGFVSMMVAGVALQYFIFRHMANQEMRQTLVTIGISIVLADLMIAVWTGTTYQFEPPEWLFGAINLPIISTLRANGDAIFIKYPIYRLAVLVIACAVGAALWFFLGRTRAGIIVRAGVDDREMLAACGVNIQVVFMAVSAIGAGLAGFAGVIGGTALSIAPGEDVRYLLVSLVVVIVGGMGSVAGAALGALIIGVTEQVGLVYFPTYGVVFTFLIMVAVLAWRPRGIFGGQK